MRYVRAYTGLVATISLCGCIAQESSEVQDQDWEGITQGPSVDSMPLAASEKMKEMAGSSNVAPQYFACPPYMSYTPIAFDASYTETYAWYGVAIDWFQINSVEWIKYSNSIHLMCRTTQSPHDGMAVRKIITGFTQCSTSNDTPQADGAWFVCF